MSIASRTAVKEYLNVVLPTLPEDSPLRSLLTLNDKGESTLEHVVVLDGRCRSAKAFLVINERGKGPAFYFKSIVGGSAEYNPESARKLFAQELAYVTVASSVTPEKFPKLFFSDVEKQVLIYERLEPHVCVRDELIAGNVYPLLAEDLSSFFARSLKDYILTGTPTVIENSESLDILQNSSTKSDIRNQLVGRFSSELSESLAGKPGSIGALSTDVLLSLISNCSELRKAYNLLDKSFSKSTADMLQHGSLTTAKLMSTVIRSSPKIVNFETLRPEEYLKEADWANFVASQTAEGDLRLVSAASSAKIFPGFDIGTVLGSLLIHVLVSNSGIQEQQLLVDKGGYAAYTAKRKRDALIESTGVLANSVMELVYFTAARLLETAEVDGKISRDVIDRVVSLYKDAAHTAAAFMIATVFDFLNGQKVDQFEKTSKTIREITLSHTLATAFELFTQYDNVITTLTEKMYDSSVNESVKLLGSSFDFIIKFIKNVSTQLPLKIAFSVDFSRESSNPIDFIYERLPVVNVESSECSPDHSPCEKSCSC